MDAPTLAALSRGGIADIATIGRKTGANLLLTCACGRGTIGNEDEVVTAAIENGRTLHNMDVTREQALSMAQPSKD